jgi:hypothetical protein
MGDSRNPSIDLNQGRSGELMQINFCGFLKEGQNCTEFFEEIFIHLGYRSGTNRDEAHDVP